MPSARSLRRAIAVWCVIAAAETIHGVLREILLAPIVGGSTARQVAVGTGSVLVCAIAWVFSRWMGGRARGELLIIGMLWVTLTMAFEVGLGRALGYSWARIAADYDVGSGGLMPIGLVVMLLAPLAAARVREATRARAGDWGSPPLRA
jgi:hypothetical protein